MWGLYIHTDVPKSKPKRIPKPTPLKSAISIPKPFSFLFHHSTDYPSLSGSIVSGGRKYRRVIKERGTITSTQFNPFNPYQFNPYQPPSTG